MGDAAEFLAHLDRPTVSGYRVLNRLGRGGQASVFEAEDGEGRRVALKVWEDPDLQTFDRRVRREADALKQLSHPHIVKIHAVAEDLRGAPCLVLELIVGSNLAEHLQKRKISTEEVTRIGIRLAGALEHLHGHGIIHRDVKPSNVVLRDPDHEPVLVDLGIAKADSPVDGVDARSLTTGRAALGTYPYMSPEQREPGEGRADVGPQTDVYSLGALLFECVTGRPPWKGNETRWERLNRSPVSRPVFTDASIEHLTPPLRYVIERCLEGSPARRFASAAEVREALLRGERGARASRALPALILALAAACLVWLLGGATATDVVEEELGPAGLRFLRRNPSSGLREFWHPASGERPGAPGREVAPGTGLIFVEIPSGTFVMGAGPLPDEQPPQEVHLQQFYISKYEMTQAQWQRLTGSNPSGHTGPTLPVDSVTWCEADRVLFERGLALPTEAQWERVAAAPGRDYPWAGDFAAGRVAMGTTVPVDGHPEGVSWCGVAGLGANVKEWCRDAYLRYGTESALLADGERVPAASTEFLPRVARGGCYHESPDQHRSRRRGSKFGPREPSAAIGVRPILRLPTPSARPALALSEVGYAAGGSLRLDEVGFVDTSLFLHHEASPGVDAWLEQLATPAAPFPATLPPATFAAIANSGTGWRLDLRARVRTSEGTGNGGGCGACVDIADDQGGVGFQLDVHEVRIFTNRGLEGAVPDDCHVDVPPAGIDLSVVAPPGGGDLRISANAALIKTLRRSGPAGSTLRFGCMSAGAQASAAWSFVRLRRGPCPD